MTVLKRPIMPTPNRLEIHCRVHGWQPAVEYQGQQFCGECLIRTQFPWGVGHAGYIGMKKAWQKWNAPPPIR